MTAMMNEARRLTNVTGRYDGRYLYPSGLAIKQLTDQITGYCPEHDAMFSVSYLSHVNDGLACPMCADRDSILPRPKHGVRLISLNGGAA